MAFKIVIIGVDIGGLTVAIALVSKGHQVTVLEAAGKLHAIGGMIVVQPNASRILDQLGVYEAFLRICAASPFVRRQRRYTGEALGVIPADDSERLYGYPCAHVLPSVQCR